MRIIVTSVKLSLKIYRLIMRFDLKIMIYTLEEIGNHNSFVSLKTIIHFFSQNKVSYMYYLQFSKLSRKTSKSF